MNQKIKFYTLLALGGGVFNFLFNGNAIGVNALLFFILLLFSFLFFNKDFIWNRSQALITLCLTLLTGALAWHGSTYTFAICILFFVLWIGAMHNVQYFTMGHYLGAGLARLFENYGELKSYEISMTQKEYSKFSLKFVFRVILLPLALFFVFIILYSLGNFEFADIFWGNLFDGFEWFFNLFANFSFQSLLIVMLGVAITLWCIVKAKSVMKAKPVELMIRTKRKTKGKLSLGLKREYTSVLVFLIGINLLLIMFNVIDVKTFWFSYELKLPHQMRYMVHLSTYTLITSLVISIIILLYIFRGNLNFHPNVKLLKTLSIVWMFQNFILLISVAIRTLRYVDAYGLAYKRIGVLFFLVATLIGLVSLIIKVQKRKNFFYILKVNSLSFAMIFFATGLVNWDQFITSYNLSRYAQGKFVDPDFLLEMSDKTLPSLIQFKDVFQSNQSKNERGFHEQPTDYQMYELRDRLTAFQTKMKEQHFPAWNYAEHHAYKELKDVTLELEEERKPID